MKMNRLSQFHNLPRRGAKDARGMGIGPFLALSALLRGYSRFLRLPRLFPVAMALCGAVLSIVLPAVAAEER